MKKRKIITIIFETLFFPLITAGINLYFPMDPGFNSIYFLPYLLSALLFSGFFGYYHGFLNIAASITILSTGFPFLAAYIHTDFVIKGYWRTLLTDALIPLSAAIGLVYVFGLNKQMLNNQIKNLLIRMESLTKENWRTAKKNSSLLTVNHELEERVSKQQDSITSLYTQINKLDTVHVPNTLKTLLETVQIFTKATKASIWEFDASQHKLMLVESTGWSSEKGTETTIDLENSIEGWVYRNNQIFSVRMLLQYDNLQKMDEGRNLITLPLDIGKKVWGILNIEEMPFVKYNLYTERILHIITNLTQPALTRAIEYESMIQKAEIDNLTGLPLYSQFYRFLEEEINRMTVEQGTLSTIILEITNYARLVSEHNTDAVRNLIPVVTKELDTLLPVNGNFFHYREKNQIAFIFSNLDYDGASLFCLEALEKINSDIWSINSVKIPLEVVIGYSSFSGTQSVKELLDQAELLLTMQKV